VQGGPRPFPAVRVVISSLPLVSDMMVLVRRRYYEQLFVCHLV
jgi:hypothetical protein